MTISGHHKIDEKIIAFVVPELWDLAPAFLLKKKEEAHSLSKLFSEKNYSAICFLTHNMKGAGGTYGMTGLTKLCSDLMKSAEEKNDTQIATLINELSDYLNRIQLKLSDD